VTEEVTTVDLMPPAQRHALDLPKDPVPGSDAYNDAQLYKIIVAKALREGRFRSKGEFDLEVRRFGTIKDAEEIIAFSKLRPGCNAWRYGRRFVCECGTSWRADDSNPPACKME
jgi:hypothetical protein